MLVITPLEKFPLVGVVTTVAGKVGFGGYIDAQGTEAEFQAPAGIAVGATGNIFVADQGNSVIRKITPEGKVTTLAGQAGERGTIDGMGRSALFSYPIWYNGRLS